jgi:hypothetical protein
MLRNPAAIPKRTQVRLPAGDPMKIRIALFAACAGMFFVAPG